MSTNAGTVTPNGPRAASRVRTTRDAGSARDRPALLAHTSPTKLKTSTAPVISEFPRAVRRRERLLHVDVLPGEADEPDHEHARHDREHELDAREQRVAEERDQHGDREPAGEPDEQQLALAQRAVELGSDEHDRERRREEPEQHRAPEQPRHEREHRRHGVAEQPERRARDDHRRLPAALAGERRQPERDEREGDAGEDRDHRLAEAQAEPEDRGAQAEAEERGVRGEPEPEQPRRAADAVLGGRRLDAAAPRA